MKVCIYTCVCVCVCVCVCLPPHAARWLSRCSQGQAARQSGSGGSHGGISQSFYSAEIPLRGNILHYHWREDKQSNRWRRKPWAFNRFSTRLLTPPVQQSICETLEVVRLVHIVAVSQKICIDWKPRQKKKKHRCCVGNVHKTCNESDPGTGQSIPKENRGSLTSCASFLYPGKLLKRNEALDSAPGWINTTAMKVSEFQDVIRSCIVNENHSDSDAIAAQSSVMRLFQRTWDLFWSASGSISNYKPTHPLT